MQGDLPFKSKSRVADHGEVFTAKKQVRAMLDLVKKETVRPESKFLEPACGHGNFLEEILQRKLRAIAKNHKNSQDNYERDAIIAVGSIYGIDILEDNVKESRNRMFRLFKKQYKTLFDGSCRAECLTAIEHIIKENIIWGDTLRMWSFENKEPIFFYDWHITGKRKIIKSRYEMQYLVEKGSQQGGLNMAREARL